MPRLSKFVTDLGAILERDDQRALQDVFGVTDEMMAEPEAYDPEHAGREMRHEQMCEAIGNVAKVIRESSQAQLKAISDNVVQIPDGLATDAGIKASLEMLGKVVARAIKAAEASDNATGILERMADLVGICQRQQDALMQLLQAKESEDDDEEDEDDEPVVFQIQRDRNGYIQQVIAKPYEEPEPEDAGMTIN